MRVSTNAVEQWPAADHRIVQPGSNCWRSAAAERAAVLVDGEAFFNAFAEAAERARHSILIAGWDFNTAVRLHPAAAVDDDADRIGNFLDRLVRRRRSLNIYVLDWDFSFIYALQRQLLPRLRVSRRLHRRFRFRLDNRHPMAGAQHQKIAVIDDAIAFVGGFDFAACRWDTPAHAPQDERRIDPWGKPYPPYHDVAMAVDGAAATALADLFRHRWRRATGQRLRAAPRGLDPWPSTVQPDFRHVDVAVARTMPAFEGEAEKREVEALFVDAIAAARHSLYIENQYLTAGVIGDALAARLREPDGPEIVILQPRRCEGWLEEVAMGVLRARLMRQLADADHNGRLRVYYPDLAGLDDRRLTVHSKVMVVDDRLLRVGSANLNNRSMGLDSECDLAIEAGDDAEVRVRIAAVRDRLMGEHLGQPPERVAQLIAETGSLIAAIERLSSPARGLRPLDPSVEPWLDQLVPDATYVDPERPVDAEKVFSAFAARPAERGYVRSWLWPLAAAAGASALWAWVM
jgi:phosphatidylserine/phosphatidylglycerophosphate/cardiolipin synthase-like enzyme